MNIGTLREMDGTRRQLFGQLQAAGFVSRRARLDGAVPCQEQDQQLYSFARNQENLSLVKCVLTAALYPSVARIGAPAGNSKRPVLLTRTESVAIHPSSVVSAGLRRFCAATPELLQFFTCAHCQAMYFAERENRLT